MRKLIAFLLVSACAFAQGLGGTAGIGGKAGIGGGAVAATVPTVSCAGNSGSSSAPSVTVAITSGHLVVSALAGQSAATVSAWKTSNNDTITMEPGYPVAQPGTLAFGHGTATGTSTTVSLTLSSGVSWILFACDVTGLTALDVADTVGAFGGTTWISGTFTTTATDTLFGLAYMYHNVALTCTDTQGAIINDATFDQAAILCYHSGVAPGAGRTVTGTTATTAGAIGAGYKP